MAQGDQAQAVGVKDKRLYPAVDVVRDALFDVRPLLKNLELTSFWVIVQASSWQAIKYNALFDHKSVWYNLKSIFPNFCLADLVTGKKFF